MDILKLVWAFMDGKKSWTGIIILAATALVTAAGGSAEDVASVKNVLELFLEDPKIYAALVGFITTITGLLHRDKKQKG